MSKALKCDRCGDFYIPDDSYQNRNWKRNRLNFFNYNYDGQSVGNSKYFDLCPRCADQLQSWLDRPMREIEEDE